jgi:hypothetical protein
MKKRGKRDKHKQKNRTKMKKQMDKHKQKKEDKE